MKRVAFLTATCMLEDHADAREDAWEHTLEFAALSSACKHRLITLEEQIWDAPDLDLSPYEAAIIGTCWDYMEKPDLFLETLDKLGATTRLLNPVGTIKWNSDKSYLRNLSDQGIATIPTVWADRADERSIRSAFDTLGADDVVIKPRIGASAWRQARLKRSDPIPDAAALPPSACLIQPFLKAAESEGELTLLFFDRVFSHGLVKKPKAGDYRTQSMYGAKEEKADPPEDALAVAHAALESVAGPLLYARVDLMRGADGGWKVMELELIEPYLYPEQGEYMGAHFSAALDRLLANPA
ncbi:RimK family alpha-L-glutamate ligase [Hyphobacterium sp.]|uniref:ATP-grasp domain-containing protein n=1 Tax=Hyphobacterium sp. TaxID=2004662 RepID=UPI00374A6018